MQRKTLFIIFGIILAISVTVFSLWIRRQTPHFNNDTVWVSDFIRYDSCKFTSNSGATSTLTIWYSKPNKERNLPILWSGWALKAANVLILNPHIVLDNSHFLYSPIGYVMFSISSSEENMEGSFSVYKPNLNNATLVDMSLYNRHMIFPGTYGAELVEQDFQYKDKLFKECFVMDSINSYVAINKDSPVDRDINKAVVSKEYGLIYYSFSDGEEFFRDLNQ